MFKNMVKLAENCLNNHGFEGATYREFYFIFYRGLHIYSFFPK